MSDEFVVSIAFKGSDQMSRPAQNMTRAMDGLARSSNTSMQGMREAGGAASALGGAIKGALAGIAFQQVVSFAEDFNELGTQVRYAREMFTQFGGGEEVLESLRRATRGVVDDMTLMLGAGRLMNLGVTQTMGDATRLIGMIEAVKAPAEDTMSALENFSLMMANQSFLRLDTFGLNSAMVRDRVEELKDTLNMSSEAAFAQATMEALEQKVTSLGDAAYASDTALNRLGTTLANFAQGHAEQFAGTIETAATAATQLADAAARGELVTLLRELRESGDMNALDQLGMMGQLARAGITGFEIAGTVVEGLSGAFNEAGSASASAFLEGFANPENIDPTVITRFIDVLNTEMDRQLSEFGQDFVPLSEDLIQMWRDVAPLPPGWQMGDVGTETIRAAAFWLDSYRDMQRESGELLRIDRDRLEIMQRGSDAIRQQAIERRREGEEARRAMYENDAASLRDQLEGLYTASAGNGFRFWDEQDALTASAIRNEIEAVLDAAEEAKKLGLIDDAALATIKQAAADAGVYADNIERGAEAMRNLTLSQAFGQGGGGLMGEVNNMLLAQLGERGLSGDALQGITDALNLASGVETAASISMRDEVTPMLADIYYQYGETAAVLAAESFSRGIRAAAENGTILTPDMLPGLTGWQRMGGGGRQINVRAGDNPHSLAEQYGGTWQDYMPLLDENGILQQGMHTLGGGLSRIPNGMFMTQGFGASQNGAEFADMAANVSQMATEAPTAADAFTEMATGAAEVETRVRSVKDIIGELASGSHKVSVELDVKYPAVLDLLLNGGQREMLNNTTRGNGGRVPGADPRGRQIERG